MTFLTPILLAAATPAAAADELVLDRASGFTVPAQVNGASLTLRVDPAASGLVMLNEEAARRAGLTGSQFRAWTAGVGPVKLAGKGQSAPAAVAGRSAWLRFLWFERDIANGADGLISVAELPYERVVMKLRAAEPGEIAFSYPVAYTREIGLYFAFPDLSKPIPVQFSTTMERSLATAAAGAQIAVPFKGGWDGDPQPAPIRFGIRRPVRPLALRKPMDLEGLALDRLFVRVSDNRGGYELPADPAEDPDEIVVTGKVAGQPPRSNLTLGADVLGACSSIAFDRTERRLTLRCRPSAALPKVPATTP